MPGPGSRQKYPRGLLWRMKQNRKNKGKKQKRPEGPQGGGREPTGGAFPGIPDERPPGGASGGRVGEYSSGGVVSWQDLVKKKYSS